jgi:GPH family glycoside/pentoside/hexuronide:cation symporter
MLAYGVLGFPLAFAALPLYVHVPNLYADSVGLPLALVGAVLLLTRFADALIDPLLGQWSDRLGNRRRLILIALPLLGLGLAALLAPPADGEVGGIAWLVLSLSADLHRLQSGHHQLSRLGRRDRRNPAGSGTALPRRARCSRWAAWWWPPRCRRCWPSDVATAMQHLGWLFIPILALAALATFAGAPPAAAPARDATPGLPLSAVFADLRFRRLLLVLATGGIASAIPATLVLFFIADVLRLQEWQGLFLVIYFVCGGLALPGWVALARRHGKLRAWMASMVLAIASFVWAFLLDAGDGLAFALICAASGAALGAELALPPALLADLLADGKRKGQAAAGAGAYFGVWNFVNKFNLALAAGIALPLVALFGYQVGAGATASQGLLALAATYALLPAAIKLVSLWLLWRWQHHFEGRTS